MKEKLFYYYGFIFKLNDQRITQLQSVVHVPGRKRTRRQKFLFVLDKAVEERTRPQYYDTLKDWFVRNAQVPEQTKALVFIFVFVFALAHEQAISI